MSRTILILKGLSSLGLLAIVLYAGFANFPLWSILLFGIPFTIAYIDGKRHLWTPLFQQGGLRLYRAIALTYCIQLIVIGVFYLIGSGMARLFNR